MDSNQALIVGVVVAGIAIAAITVLMVRKRRSQKLREHFGLEYDRVVEHEGNVRKGEGVLEFRQKRRDRYKIRPLSPSDRSNFRYRWDEVQSQFVDDPKATVTVADKLVAEVMQARGYPMGDFEQRSDDLSVDYPTIIEHYRAGHEIALRHNRGEASTEDLRQAMVHYRTLFEELLGHDETQRKGA